MIARMRKMGRWDSEINFGILQNSQLVNLNYEKESSTVADEYAAMIYIVNMQRDYKIILKIMNNFNYNQ